MVPMADMLNAAHGRDNAHLSVDDDQQTYTMIATRPIAKGEQIYNTYSSPPNAELLRKYGHVDILPLQTHILHELTKDVVGDWPFGNPEDEAMIEGSLIMAMAQERCKVKLDERVDWWLEEGGEECVYIVSLADRYNSTFAIGLSTGIEPDMISFARVLTCDQDWSKARKRGRIPDGVWQKAPASTVAFIEELLKRRLEAYKTEYTVSTQLMKLLISKGRSRASQESWTIGQSENRGHCQSWRAAGYLRCPEPSEKSLGSTTQESKDRLITASAAEED